MNQYEGQMESWREPGATIASQTDWRLAASVLTALVLLLYFAVLRGMVVQWWEDPNYTHGFLVPIFVGYVLWTERGRWRAISIHPNDLGLLVMVSAVLLLIGGTLGAELFTARLSLVILIWGGVLYLAGGKMFRAMAFPLGFLIFMIPLPVLIYNQVTFPLQLEASAFAARVLEILRVPVLREGNLLYLPHYTLEVVEACSGIRSLMSLLALAVTFGYLAGGPTWIRLSLVALTFPIAIVSNGIRIVGTGLMANAFGQQWAEGFFHAFSGWLIFLSALALTYLAYWILFHVDRRLKRVHA